MIPPASDPLVSVITPCFRQGRFLEEALASVRGQTYPYVEHIVVNDGSDDDTDAVAQRHAHEIRYIKQANQGQSAARNAGLAAARGTFALFLDADDTLCPNGIAALVDATRGHVNCFSAGAWWFGGAGPDPGTPPGLPVVGDPQLITLLTTNVAPIHACMAPVDALRALGGFRVDLKAHEDWDVWLRLVIRGLTIVTTTVPVAWYRDTPVSVSKDMRRMLEMRAVLLVHMLEELSHRPRQFEATHAIVLEGMTTTLRRLLAQGAGSQSHRRALRTGIQQLRQHGIGENGPWRRLMIRTLGSYTEDLTVAWYRLAEPSMLRYYRRSWL